MMSEERLKQVERLLRDPEARSERQLFGVPTRYDIALSALLDEHLRLRQIIADVRRLVATVTPDNAEVRG